MKSNMIENQYKGVEILKRALTTAVVELKQMYKKCCVTHKWMTQAGVIIYP
jgi:hypothetical protein